MTEREQVRQHTVLDDTSRQVAKVYAESLYAAAKDESEQTGLLAELQALTTQVFARLPDLETFLASRVIGRDRKEAALRRAFAGKTSDTFLHFLLVLNKHDRLDLLRPITAAYHELHDERQGRMPVAVYAAVPLEPEQEEQLRQQLRTRYGKEPMLETHVDPDLLGGLVVRVGDRVFDASVRTRLQSIRDQLIQRSGHEIQSGRDRFCTD
jgi:F-type H+-transporting ATPase subunit delta